MNDHRTDGATKEERKSPKWERKFLPFAEDMIVSLEKSKYNHQNTDLHKLSNTGRYITNIQESECFYELKLNSPKKGTNKHIMN